MKIVIIFLFISSYSITQSLINGYEKSHYDFNNGLCGVKKDGKWGFVDTNNNLVVNTIYDEVGYFINCSKLAIVIKNGKLGLIDTKGKVIVDIIYDINENTFIRTDCTDKNANLIYVEKNGKAGLINNQGKMIIDPIIGYDEIGDLESVSEQSWDATFFRNGYCAVKRNDKWGFIDSTGKEIIACKYEHVQPISKKKFAFEIDNKWGIKNLEERIIIPNIYDAIEGNEEKGYFIKNLCKVGEFTTPDSYIDMKWGYIDSLNKTILPIKYDNIAYPNSKKNIIVDEKNIGCYCLNELGKRVNDLTFSTFSEFEDNYAKVGIGEDWSNMKYGLLDLDCKIAVPVEYSDIYHTSDELYLSEILRRRSFDNISEEMIKIANRENKLFSPSQREKLEKNGEIEANMRILIPFRESKKVKNNSENTSTFNSVQNLGKENPNNSELSKTNPKVEKESTIETLIKPGLVEFKNNGVIEKMFFGIFPSKDKLFSLVYRPGGYVGGYERAKNYILKTDLLTKTNEKICLSGYSGEYPCLEMLSCFRNNSMLNQTNTLFRYYYDESEYTFERNFDINSGEIKDNKYKLNYQFEIKSDGNIETYEFRNETYKLGNGIGALLSFSNMNNPYLFIHDYKNSNLPLKICAIPRSFDVVEFERNFKYNITGIQSVFQNDKYYYVFLNGGHYTLPVLIRKSDLDFRFIYDNKMNIGNYKEKPNSSFFESENQTFFLPYSQGFANYFHSTDRTNQDSWQYFICLNVFNQELEKINSIRIDVDKKINWVYEFENYLIIAGSTDKKGYLGYSNPWIRVVNKKDNKTTYEKVIVQKNAEFDYITSDGNGNIIFGIGSVCCHGLETDATFTPKIIIDRLDNSGRFQNDLFH